MKLGSLFDGSGGFPLAGSLCGIEPVWAAEVEPYPIAVTKSRFPTMKHLGDVSKINGAEIEPVDVITFGSPCQDLSVAGKRAGLKHESNGDRETTRSGLFMDAVRIIREMRDATHGKCPTFVLWENVPGAFSSNKGEDFRTVLQEFVKIVEPSAVMPEVPAGGWAYADSYCGDGWSLAYRILDAQYWGVPQRRRRIFLVLDLGGERARKILFEREGLRGDFAQSRTPGQTVTRTVAGCVGADDREGKNCVEQCLFENHAQDARYRICPKVSPMLSAHLGTGGNNQPPVVAEESVYCLQGNGIGRSDTTGCEGRGWNDETCYTLNTIDRPAVVFAMQGFGDYKDCGVVSGLKARDYKNSTDLVCGVDCRNLTETPELFPTLQAKPNGGQSLNYTGAVRTHYIVRRLTPTECARLQGFPDTWGHPDYKSEFTDAEYRYWLDVRNTHAAINGKQVREYTNEQMVKWYNKLHTDSAEYKMWGNGIALPCALYCMQGIAEVLQ